MKLYPRVWFSDGGHLDLAPLPEEDCPAFEERWRAVHARVEWLLTPQGRLDLVLPQTLPRLVHNANVRSWVEHRNRRSPTP